MGAKRSHSNRKTTKFKPGAVMVQPSSPAGKVRAKGGKTVNLGLIDPAAPSWRGAPYTGWFGTSREK
jgi:hypothetical protein